MTPITRVSLPLDLVRTIDLDGYTGQQQEKKNRSLLQKPAKETENENLGFLSENT